MATCEPCKHIRIRGIGLPFKTDLTNVSNRQGVSACTVTKPLLKEILAGYPDEVKEKQHEIPETNATQKKPYLDLRGTSAVQKQQLKNICDYLGVTPSDFLKVKMGEKIMALPAPMKAHFNKD